MGADDIRMKRKIQQLGSSTLAVTLPAEWAREHDARKGDEVIVQRDESGGSLLIVPDSSSSGTETATIDADPLEPGALERAILAQYVLGRQLIRIDGETPLSTDVLDSVTSIERQLMGLGVVEQGTDHVDVRCSVAPGDFELPTLLERLWRTEATMREHAIEALTTGDPDGAQRTIHHERQIEKLFYLFLRLLFTTYRNPRLNESVGLETGFPLIGYRSIAQDVVLMAGVARRIAGMVTEAGGTIELEETAATRFRTTADTLETAAAETRTAVTDPTHETVGRARESLDAHFDSVEQTQRYLETERPEPLLVLQRSLTALHSSGTHATDSLDVASHFAFRSEPTVEGSDSL
ncbi:AbrB/MazE/SpoVT family DNA-binding domain-containing protein [Natrarchaeobius sp. A-rgal3]|uniref:AbrB/MazE/SpoVT family DNA-binding domain-containing protein n=1 Tax=Natrarchaeobius versutus TaxID=1679078 RepID=UPI00350EF8AC